MKSTFKICFRLRPTDEIGPWQGSDGPNLHWFGLTWGDYWITTPLGEALRYTEEQQRIWGFTSPYVDYNVARLFEDVQCMLPFALEPVPMDIAELTTDRAWYNHSFQWMGSSLENDERIDLWHGANEWWHDRHIDTLYLVDGPHFNFWRIGDQVFVRWEYSGPTGIWEVPSGQFVLDVTDFQTAVFDFLDEVIMQMDQRVQTIATKGWTRPGCDLDVKALVREQQQRAIWVNENKQRRANTDWISVRGFLERLQNELRRT